MQKLVCFGLGIAYYSEREMIDFLGKSDDFVGRINPKRNLNNKNYNFNDFHPGHNKWDFQYSIGKLKPDIILREWPDENFDLEIKKNNYKRMYNNFKRQLPNKI